MPRVRFLAATADLRPGQEGVVYGPQHETDFQAEDVDFVIEAWLAGKLEVTDKTGLPEVFQPVEAPAETPPA